MRTFLEFHLKGAKNATDDETASTQNALKTKDQKIPMGSGIYERTGNVLKNGDGKKYPPWTAGIAGAQAVR